MLRGRPIEPRIFYCYAISLVVLYNYTELEVYFMELDYAILEDEGESYIELQFRSTQSPFNLTLRPVTIDQY